MAAHFAFLKRPLAKEIALILLLKLVVLMGIRSVWFDAAAVVKDDSVTVGQHLLGTPSVSPEKTSQ